MSSFLIIMSVMTLSSGIALAVLGSLSRTGIPGVRYWLGANVLPLVALPCFMLQTHAAPLLTIIFSNSMLAVSGLLGLEGYRRFFGIRSLFVPAYLAAVWVPLGLAYFTYVSWDLSARIIIVSVFHAFVYACIGITTLRGRPLERPGYSYWFAGIIALIGSFGHLFHALANALHPASAPYVQMTPAEVVFLALGILALPSLSVGAVMLVHDRMNERLERVANIDELTGVLSRRAFLARAAAMLDDLAREGQPASLAIIDIDQFKRVNDLRGHANGDQVLRHFALLTGAGIRNTDLFGRLGGEEFAVLCPYMSRRDAVYVLDRLRERIAGSPCPLAGGSLTYTFSVGVDQYRPGEPLSALLARADGALYEAKAKGRNRVVASA